MAQKCHEAELLLQAYYRWEFDLPEHLHGRFSFAIRDERLHAVFACVDHLGTLPLLYRSTDRGLIVAGDMKTMLYTPNCPRELNLDALRIAGNFDELPLEPGTCLHKGIYALPPGHCLISTAKSIRLRRYWLPSVRPELAPAREKDIYAQARHLTETSVSNHLEDNESVALMFSGGLDSSALAITATDWLRRRGKRLLAVCAVNDPDHSHVPDERPFMEQLRCIDNLDFEFVDSRGKGPFDGIEDPAGFETTPRLPGLRYVFESAFEASSGYGADILLHGGGGEWGISGTPSARFLEPALGFRWGELAQELRLTSQIRSTSPVRLFAGEVRRYFSRPRDRQVFFLTPGTSSGSSRHRRYSPLWPDSAQDQLRTLRNIFDRCLIPASQPRQYVSGYCQPLYDKDLLEYCLAVPARFKSRNGYGRFLIRKAFESALPPGLAWRKDPMWGSPDYNWRYNRQIGRAQAFVRSIRKSDPVREIVDIPRLELALQPIEDLWMAPGKPKRHPATFSSLPATINLINFLRQFPGFGV